MRTRIAAGVMVLSAGLLVVGALPVAAKSPKITSSYLKNLQKIIGKGQKITFDATYKQVSSGGQTQTITIAQAPPKSNFSTGTGEVIDTGSKTYYCSGSGSAPTCLATGTSNPFAGLEAIFSPAAAISAFSEAKEGLVSKALGIKVASSSVTIGGQPSTCITVTSHGQGGKYCVTNKGVLSYSGGNGSYFQLVKYSTSPPTSLFQLPAGATTQTLPAGVSIP